MVFTWKTGSSKAHGLSRSWRTCLKHFIWPCIRIQLLPVKFHESLMSPTGWRSLLVLDGGSHQQDPRRRTRKRGGKKPPNCCSCLWPTAPKRGGLGNNSLRKGFDREGSDWRGESLGRGQRVRTSAGHYIAFEVEKTGGQGNLSHELSNPIVPLLYHVTLPINIDDHKDLSQRLHYINPRRNCMQMTTVVRSSS